jgi:hypothetical protein
MKINILNYEEKLGIDGILTKYAREMQRALQDLGHDVTVYYEQDRDADINHHINYISYKPSFTADTTMITHITGDKNKSEKEKVNLIKKQCETAVGICFSQDMKDKLVKAGCPEDKLEVVLPAHDGRKRRPRIIAIATKLYADGRKREQMFTDLFKTIDPEKFTFRIMGDGWKKVLEPLVKKGLRVQWIKDFREDFYGELLSTSDYLLYTGDEDALAQSIIDAKQAGLRIIAPPQKDLEVELPFNNQAELNKIFANIAVNPVEDWTWENYVKKHLKIWKTLLKKRSSQE